MEESSNRRYTVIRNNASLFSRISNHSLTRVFLALTLTSSVIALFTVSNFFTFDRTSNYHTLPWTGDPNEIEPPGDTLPEVLIDSTRLYFNRIPKAAGTTMLKVLHALAARNNFTHESSAVYNMRTLSKGQQMELIQSVHKATSPASFDRHVHFVNFNSFGYPSPVFINMVRDPVERVISDYYYRRSVARKHIESYKVKPSEYWLNKPLEECINRGDDECRYVTGYMQVGHMVPYFCGHDLRCMVVNDKWALKRAKQNIESYYSVVGIVEMLNETISAMEKQMPRFFSGAKEILQRISPDNVNTGKPQVSEAAKAILRRNLTNDFILYEYLKERLQENGKG